MDIRRLDLDVQRQRRPRLELEEAGSGHRRVERGGDQAPPRGGDGGGDADQGSCL